MEMEKTEGTGGVHGLTEDERLAVLVAMEKVIKPLVADAKGDARIRMMAAYDQCGADGIAIEVGGRKVGKVGITYTTERATITPGREADALSYLESIGLAEMTPRKDWERRFMGTDGGVIDRETGEVMDWASMSKKVPRGAAVYGCKPDDVIPAVRGLRGDAHILSLLEGGA